MNTRPIARVPKLAFALLFICFLLQIGRNFGEKAGPAKFEKLPSPPPLELLRLSSFGDPISSAKMLSLYLQASDQQAGIRVGFRQLDYTVVQEWMRRILDLDPPGQYPLLLASRVYGEVSNPAQQQQMLNFVYEEFRHDPNRRWPWLAHAAVLAKHRLHDLPLARQYAKALRSFATGSDVPHWVGQMEIFFLDDMNEQQSARLLLGALLDSGTITDQHELNFLQERLAAFDKKLTPPSTEKK